MLRVSRLAVMLGGVALLAGCGSREDCTQTPLLASQNNLPSSCSFQPGSTVRLQVRWCSCAAATACQVLPPDQGFIQVEPRVQSCDETCNVNPASCGVDLTTCEIPVPSTGDTFHLTVISGSGESVDVPLHVSSVASNSCS